ncbi:MAG TPA: Stp1/IreP family PP2C-type Ser/Thr phosphatase [Polyangia bacterium]|jgi:serine/threonine protein phosphatase PrpC|nr:Stp1/IreP family PP2C-type Ser/Thr phosphatase [Polyangia bacterium]
MELNFWAATDVGKKREVNEDNFLVDKKLSLFIVADGMGGHASGEVASHLAVHEFRNAVDAGKEMIEKFSRADASVRPQDILTLLEAAVQAAGHAIYHKGQAEPEKRGMGTTTSALLIAGDRGFIAHVGDSRIYMLRAGQVVQLTEDHSLVNELIRRGRITREGLDGSPYKAYKNAVTRAVGVYETVQGDTIDFEILPGDQFLLCSDGLHAYLDDARIIELLKGEDITELPRRLVDHANAGGGHDNITAVIVRVEAPQPGATEERAEELTRKVDMLKQMPLFRHLIYKEILRVVNVTQVREYAAGDEIIKEGQPGDEMFVLLRGKIRLHKNNAFITHLVPGAHIGEMALVDPRQPRSASATADERSRVLILRRRDFYEIIRKEPQLSVKLLWSFVQVLADRLRKTTADLSGARLEAGALDMTEDVLFDE